MLTHLAVELMAGWRNASTMTGVAKVGGPDHGGHEATELGTFDDCDSVSGAGRDSRGLRGRAGHGDERTCGSARVGKVASKVEGDC